MKQIKVNRKLLRLFLLIPLVCLIYSCSKTSDIEPIVGVEGTVTVIKDSENFYWAIPGNGIEKVDGDKIYIKADVIFSHGKGEGNVEKIAQTLKNNRYTQRGSFQATSSTITETDKDGKEIITKLYDCFTGITTKPIVLTITEVVEVVNKKSD